MRDNEAIAIYLLSSIVDQNNPEAGQIFAWSLMQLGYGEDDIRAALSYAELVEGVQE